MDGSRQTVERDDRSWKAGSETDVAWINDGTPESPGNGINQLVPELYAAYWTVDVPGSAGRDPHTEDPLALDYAVVSLFATHATGQPWWLGFLDRGGLSKSQPSFLNAPQINVVNGGHVLIEAGPDQALAWRDGHDWLHGPLPDVMFPRDRSWLAITGWDDYWMSVGGTAQLLDGFLNHPQLSTYTRQVSYQDPDATPPGHDVFWR